MTWRMGKRQFLTAIGVLALAMVAAVVWGLMPTRFDDRLPDPNGYDDLVAAARMIAGEMPTPKTGDYSTVDTEALRAFVDPNLKALERARLGLSRESRVRLPLTFMDPTHMEDEGKLRILARLLWCESVLDERAGHLSKAADEALDIVRLGHDVGKGGIMIDYLVALAIESTGMSALSRLVPMLPSQDVRRLSAELARIDGAHEPYERVVDQDQAYARSRGELRVRAIFVLAPSFVSRMNAASVAALEQADRRSAAYRRLLLVKLALRAYRLDHPDAPVPPTLAALVPVYLAAVPDDPFGKGPLKLHVDAAGSRAAYGYGYSVGPDGKDDGGSPIPLKTLLQPGAAGDLTLDLP